MFDSIEIVNLRGIRHGELQHFAPLTIIVGPNGAGKSTVLDALFIAASQAVGSAIVKCFERRPLPHPSWLVHRSADAARIDLNWASIVRSVAIDVGSVDRDETRVSAANIDHRTSPVISEVKGVITVNRYNGEVDHSFVPPSKGWPLQPEQKAIELIDDAALKKTDVVEEYSRMVLSGRSDILRNIAKQFIPTCDHIEVLRLERPSMRFPSPPMRLVAVSSDGRVVVPLEMIGDGAQSLLKHALLLSRVEDGIAMIEEPELHKHPAAIRHLTRLIFANVRRGAQVVVTTHSLEVIDGFLAEVNNDAEQDMICVQRVRMEDGILKGTAVHGADVSIARTVIDGDLR